MKYLSITILCFICFICFGNVKAQNLSQNSDQKRIIEDIKFSEIGSFYPSDEGLFRPELVSFDVYTNKFFIYDYGVRNLVSIHLEDLASFRTKTIQEIGNGYGSGPGEFRNPTGICLANDETSTKVVIVDADLARVSIWDGNNNTLIRSFRPKRFVPFRVACNTSNIVLFNANFHPLGSIAVYDFEGNLLSHIKEFGRDKNNISSMESGHLTMNFDQIYYAGQDVEVLKNFSVSDFSFKGKTVFIEAQKNIDDVQVTKKGEEVIFKKGKGYLYRSRGIGTIEQNILVFYSGRDDAYGNIIDFYSTEDLSYKYSVRIDNLANEMNLYNDYIILNTYDFDRRETYLKVLKIEQ